MKPYLFCLFFYCTLTCILAGCAQQQTQSNLNQPVALSTVRAMEQAYSLEPNNEELQYRLISAYIRNEQYIEARSLLSRTLNVNSDSIEANYLMGLTYGRQKLFEEAKIFYNNVIEQNPNHIPTLFNLAVIDEKTNNYAHAKRKYEKILTKIPNDPDTNYNLALLYDEKFIDPRNAIYHYKLYLKHAQYNAELHYRKTIIERRIKELEFIEREKNL
ncbi:MAG: tetratricopeptide repeat protein [Candidatus Auribacterota bacterium]|jgi:tetratricopeptide (TPR) repeat protein|nr:tetratricopeptide repeat protein [Candidatus Auribacterota bacterium]